MKTFLTLTAASLIWGTAFAQETTEQRLAALERNEAAAKQQQHREAAPAKNATTERSSITAKCDQPLMVVANISSVVRALCDVNNDGVVDVDFSFFRLPETSSDDFISALAVNSTGGTLFVGTSQGSIFRMNDTNQDGAADLMTVTESSGLAYTERILPLAGDTPFVYTENAQGGRYNLYRFERFQTLVQAGDVPRGARRVAGSIMTRDGVLTIDAANDVVRKYAFNGVGYLDNTNSKNDVLLNGVRITSLAYDEPARLLFVLMAGDCGDVVSQPVTGPTPLPTVPCATSIVKVFRLNGTSLQQVGAMNHTLLDVSYNHSGHPMVARNGKLYIAVSAGDRERGGAQQILEVRYDRATGRPTDAPTIFADSVHLGSNYPYIKALSFFDGGPNI